MRADCISPLNSQKETISDLLSASLNDNMHFKNRFNAFVSKEAFALEKTNSFL